MTRIEGRQVKDKKQPKRMRTRKPRNTTEVKSKIKRPRF